MTRRNTSFGSFAPLLATATLVVAAGADAAPQRLSAAAAIGPRTAACNASSATITRSSPLTFTFSCASTNTSFRCALDGTTTYTVADNRISATCYGITEVPRSNPADLMFAAGAEG